MMVSNDKGLMQTSQINLSTETLNFIDHLITEDYHDEDIYNFISEYGEENLITYYEKYVELGEEYNYDAVDAFLTEFDFADLNRFEDAFYGCYESEEHFAQDYTENFEVRYPSWIEIDWKATWENLSADYTFYNGFVFCNNF